MAAVLPARRVSVRRAFTLIAESATLSHRSHPPTPHLTASNQPSRLRDLAGVAILAVTYAVAGRIGFTASAVHPVVSSAWPPSGIALAALLLFGRRLWPGVAIGAFVVNVTAGIPALGAVGIAVGNTLEAVVAASLMTSFAGIRVTLDRRKDVFALVRAAIMAPLVSATIGVSVLVMLSTRRFPTGTAWLAWVTGDAIGILLMTPLILTWSAGMPRRPTARKAFEAAALALFLVALSVVLFRAEVSYVYTIFPLVVWAALRFGPRGAAAATLVVSLIAIGFTVQHVGPFVNSTPVNNLFRIQTFIGVLAITALILAAVIAERRTTEAALQRSRQEHRDIVHYASVGVYQTDPEGKILLANPALARIMGYDQPSDLIGRNLADMYWDRAERAALVAQFEPLGGEEFGIELQWKRSDGSPIWVDLHARSVRDVEGRTAYYEGFVYDLTGRKQLERQFHQAQKMEAIGRLAGGVAHDFNNLLTVISSSTDFVLGDPSLPEEHREDLTEVRKATDRATALTRQLLAFGRTQVLRPSTINLNDRLADVLPMLKRLFETTIDIRIETAPDLWPVRADAGQIEQVLLNLALNARDAMPEGGRLTFVSENAVVGQEYTGQTQQYTMKPGEYALLRVCDTGVGMDEDTQRKIFEPFFTTKDQGKGTGLGLASSYGIVKQSGGYIQVRTSRGSGAEFLIYLPRTDAALDKVVVPQERNGRRASGTILVVDDEAGIRQVLQRMLIAEGYTVIVAASGVEALELFVPQKDKINLLITDVVMPEMSGHALAQKCTALRGTLKVLFLSGYTRDSLLSQRTFDEGTEFIEKPFTRQGITDHIDRILRSEQAVTITGTA
jgi:PAS domain S-box-containing protein